MIYCHSVQITLQYILRNLTSNKKYSSSPSTSKALKSSRARFPGSNFLKKKNCQKCQKVGKLRILELRLKELSCCCIWSDGYPSSGDLCICNLTFAIFEDHLIKTWILTSLFWAFSRQLVTIALQSLPQYFLLEDL